MRFTLKGYQTEAAKQILTTLGYARDTDREVMPTERKHLLATADGDYPLELKLAKNRWERATIRHEQGLGTLQGWYRNPSAAGKNSRRIAHKSGDSWKSVQPDFVFVHLDV